MGVEHSGVGIVGRHSHNAKLFERADRVYKCKQTDAAAVATIYVATAAASVCLHLKIPLANVVRLLTEWSET